MNADRKTIIFERLHAAVELPARATANSAGYDLKAFLLGDSGVEPSVKLSLAGKQYERAVTRVATQIGDSATLELQPGESAIIPLGFRASLPVGYEAQIRPRSGTSFKTSLVIANSPGTIDPDYNGQWGVLVRNAGASPIVISHGERIAQMVITKYEVLEFTEGEVHRTTDRDGGFGSTGHR
jgi:dUTP pyrophosphatase